MAGCERRGRSGGARMPHLPAANTRQTMRGVLGENGAMTPRGVDSAQGLARRESERERSVGSSREG